MIEKRNHFDAFFTYRLQNDVFLEVTCLKHRRFHKLFHPCSVNDRLKRTKKCVFSSEKAFVWI